jgi:tRNA dimethylallyltransferase
VGSGIKFEDEELQTFLARFTSPQKQPLKSPVKRKKVIVIAGPTAVGKSQLSLIIARAIGGQIVSADSMQVYRGMDIGTAKPSLKEREGIPHHLMDSRDLDETFNVVEFYEEASQAIKEIFAKGAVPIIVGGTGFYIHSLIYGPPSGPPSDPELRKMLEAEMDSKGPHILFDKLKQLDPDYAVSITQKDRHKIVRALEIISLTRQKVSALPPVSTPHQDVYDFRCWFIHLPKETLYPCIEMRCDKMIAEGLIEEVKRLLKEGLGENPIASHAIGYRQCLEYLRSAQTQKDWDDFVRLFKQASRRYAKRQFTWFRKEPLFHWLNIDQMPMERVAELLIQDYEFGG